MFWRARMDQSLFRSHCLMVSTLSHVLASVSTWHEKYFSHNRKYLSVEWKRHAAARKQENVRKHDMLVLLPGNDISFYKIFTWLFSLSALNLREWLSVSRVEAEQGSPGSGHAHSGVEKLRRRYTALQTWDKNLRVTLACTEQTGQGKTYSQRGFLVLKLCLTCWEAHSGSWKRCWLCGNTW